MAKIDPIMIEMEDTEFTENDDDYDEISNNKSEKYIYCPDYDSFLEAIKPKLKERITDHLRHREPIIIDGVKKTVNILNELGYNMNTNTANNVSIKPYNHSFIDCAVDEMVKLIKAWKGPKYNKYKLGVITETKFDKDSINWLDQSSYKVSGDYFFAKHIEYVKRYLKEYCLNITDITNGKRENIINYGCIYFVVELLNSKIRFNRSKQQPLIRNKTLVNSVGIHKAFKILYNSLDLCQFKKNVKKNLKQKPKKKYRINSQLFCNNFKKFCQSLLNKEKQRIINDDTDIDNIVIDNNLIPDYFKDLANKTCIICTESMESNNNNSNNNNNKELKVLHCNHEYHRKCIDEWLKTKRNKCPLCINNVYYSNDNNVNNNNYGSESYLNHNQINQTYLHHQQQRQQPVYEENINNRSFQGCNGYIERENRMHLNIQSVINNNNHNERINRREIHIEEMRMMREENISSNQHYYENYENYPNPPLHPISVVTMPSISPFPINNNNNNNNNDDNTDNYNNDNNNNYLSISPDTASCSMSVSMAPSIISNTSSFSSTLFPSTLFPYTPSVYQSNESHHCI